MSRTTVITWALMGVLCIGLAGCGFNSRGSSAGSAGIFGGGGQEGPRGAAQIEASERNPSDGAILRALGEDTGKNRESLFDLFATPDQNVNVRVNRFLWNASLETLGGFLPVESVDPFTGVIVFGWGRPPGGGTAYRATVLIQDPALDARSLKVSVQSRSGPVSAETQRRIEDAILTRARQLRVRQNNL